MRATSLKNIRISTEELKEIIIAYLVSNDHDTLANHLNQNECVMGFILGDLLISIDGEVEDADR